MPLHPDVRAARDVLLRGDEDAVEGFSWPTPERYNFATDWFDGLAEEHPDDLALWVIDGDREQRLSFAELAGRSRAVAAHLAGLGLRRGDRLLVVLGNCVPLWEVMLAAIRLGAVIIPATPALSPADLADRVDRGAARLLVADTADAAKFTDLDLPLGILGVVTGADPLPPGWLGYPTPATNPPDLPLPAPATATATGRAGNDPLLLYFTSGTTAQPKLVEHTHLSYPVGHLSTMYWMGLRPGDVHLNISSPGWAKHAWSNVFAPWLAGATVLVYGYTRFEAAGLLDVLDRARVTTLCAPPTVWRMLVQADLRGRGGTLRECLSAGEPLNPEVIEQVQAAWGLTVRDGYGQTETTAQVGNPPGRPLRPGSMGRPLPGYRVVLVDPASGDRLPGDAVGVEGELCLELDPRPLPLMTGYQQRAGEPDSERNAEAFAGGVYHTGDVVTRDEAGYLTYVGRSDDVFKASDYRISPFELESVLLEHPAVAEAAVVPAPDPVRLAVAKAYVVLAAGWAPDAETARQILGHARTQLAHYKRVRRLEFAELPKTVSGKIRRVDLRQREQRSDARPAGEFRDTDFEWERT